MQCNNDRWRQPIYLGETSGVSGECVYQGLLFPEDYYTGGKIDHLFPHDWLKENSVRGRAVCSGDAQDYLIEASKMGVPVGDLIVLRPGR